MAETAQKEKLEGKAEIGVAKPTGGLLRPARMIQGELAHNQWVVHVEPNVRRPDLESEAFWSRVGLLLRPGDALFILSDDMLYHAEGVVLGAGETYAHVYIKHEYDLSPSHHEKGKPEFYAEYAGAHHKWRVRRSSDGEVIKPGFQTEKAARTWIEHRR